MSIAQHHRSRLEAITELWQRNTDDRYYISRHGTDPASASMRKLTDHLRALRACRLVAARLDDEQAAQVAALRRWLCTGGREVLTGEQVA